MAKVKAPENFQVRYFNKSQNNGNLTREKQLLQTSQIHAALSFLNQEQSASNQPFHGALACRLSQSNGNTASDRTVFNTALTAQRLHQLMIKAPFNYSVSGGELLPAMIQSASLFLNNAQQNNSVGHFSFWPLGSQYQAKPDLDDTALALNAIYSDFYKLDAYGAEVLHHTPTTEIENFQTEKRKVELRSRAWELFAPYRYSRGMKLAVQSRWAEAYPGVFSTWIFQEQSSPSRNVDDPVVIDAVALAHICHYLLDIELTDSPGLGESLTLFSNLLSHCLDRFQSTASLKEAMHSLPLQQWMPYYRSLPHFLSACAALSTFKVSSHYLSPKLSDIHQKVTALLLRSLEDDFSNDFTGQLWLWDAAVRCHLTLSSKDLIELAGLQQKDGGWPELEICTDFQGDWRWLSRTVSTAIALELLAQNNNCPSL